MQTVLVELNYMPAGAIVNNAQIMRYDTTQSMPFHSDNRNAAAGEGGSTNSQIHGTPTLTYTLGHAMKMTIKVGGTGLGVTETSGMREDIHLSADDLFVLDPFTDLSCEHALEWDSNPPEDAVRWVYVFRSTRLLDYYDMETHRLVPGP